MGLPDRHIIIVGAGIIGASIAYHLANRGVKVTVLDQNHPASGATGSSFGWIHSTVSEDAPDVLLRRASVADWHRLEKEVPELWLHWAGALSYDADTLASQAKEKMLEQADIARLEPALNTPPPRAYFAKQDGAVDPIDATRVLLEKACDLGAVLKTQTPVLGFTREGNAITGVETPQGTFNADCVVLACGTGISPLLSAMEISLPISASPAILLRYGTPDRAINTLLSGDDMEVRHARNGDILAAEDYPATGGIDEIASDALTAITRRLKGTGSARLLSQSVGQRPVPQDGCPVIGFIGSVTGLYVTVMHPAVTCAATVGRMVSEELIGGNSSEIPASYRPARFSNPKLK